MTEGNKYINKPEKLKRGTSASLVKWSRMVTWGHWSRAGREKRSEPLEELGKDIPGRETASTKTVRWEQTHRWRSKREIDIELHA